MRPLTVVRSHVRGAKLEPGVEAELQRYFLSNPAGRACEAAEHGYDPLTDPRRYLAEELAEPAHASLRHGTVDINAIREWERQEDDEHTGCGVAKADTAVAGIAVRAADTGRVLMLQRTINDESDPARGKWEFPGGKLDAGETPLRGAVREWQEETGVPLPPGEFAGSWTSDPYQGFVYVVPCEQDVTLNADGQQRLIGNPDDPDGDDCEVLAWWVPSEARRMPALRPEVKNTDWKLIDQAVPDAVFKQALRLVFRKDDPTSTDVHVDVPLGNDEPKRKKKIADVDDAEVKFLKADDDQRIVYGIVLEPDVEDTQGDVISKEDIEAAAHRYVYRHIEPGIVGDQHRKPAPDVVRPVESFIAPCDFEMNGQLVRKGSWVLAAHVPDDDLWQQVKDGRKGGWSVGGIGKRTPL